MTTKSLKTAMTCQWCGRKQQANTGLIAHHGYTKEHGYFNGTCKGSRNAPFEASRDLKPRLIIALEMIRNSWEANRNEIEAETIGITRRSMKEGTWTGSRYMYETITITRENFEEMKAARELYCTEDTFEDIKTKELASRDRAIKMLAEDIDYQKKLYAEWNQTHRFVDGAWVAL